MARAKVVLIHSGMKELLNDPRIGADLMSKLAPSLPAAQAGAPVVSGAYKESLRLELVHTDRVVARLVSDSPYAMTVEASTGNMSRSLNAAGGA